MVKGSIDSVETMGLVDGPGIRYVVFMQGCKLRCLFCHNPETWNMEDKNLNKYKVFNVKIVNNDIKGEAKPGTVIKVSKNELVISTKDGGVSILEIQPPNSKRMDIVSFLNGNKICEGETFNV